MKKNSVAKNYFFNLLYQLLTVFAPLITTPYLARVLGSENLGIHSYTLSIATYFVLFGSLGTNLYGQREIAAASDFKPKRSKIFFEINLLKIIVYILSIGSFYLCFCLKGEYKIFYTILIFELLSNLFDISWYFQGRQDFKKPVIRNFLVKTIGIILVFTMIKNPDDIVKYFLIYVLSNLFGNLTLWFYLKDEITFKVRRLSLLSHLKPILVLFIPQIATQIYLTVDKTMIGAIVGDMNQVAYYDQAQKLIRALLLIVTAMQAVVNSRVAYFYAKKDEVNIKDSLLTSVRMVWFVAIPIIFGVCIVSKMFVPLYFGTGFEDVSTMLIMTSPILLIIGLNGITGVQYLIQTKKEKLYTNSVIIGVISNVILNYILIKTIGALGAIIASIFAELVILIIQLKYVKNILSLKDIFKPCKNYIICGLIMMLIGMLLSSKLSVSLLHLLIVVAVSSLFYIILLLVFKDDFFIQLKSTIINLIPKKKSDIK